MADFAREDFASPKAEQAQASPRVAAKRLSNRSLPVSQLPPELLAQIMAGSLTFMELTWDNAQRNTLHPHPSIALSHVSSSWREVALRSHELWSRIQIQMFTRSSILEFLWRNAGSMPVDLEFCGSRLDWGPCPRAFAVISRILRTELGRIRSIRTFCEVPVLKPILSEIVGHAESLEHLQLLGMRISIDDPLPSSVGEKFLSGGAPKLRSIEIMAVSLPWTSQAFASPSLTHANFCYTENDLAGLFTFLRHAPQLEVLKVENLPYINEAFRPDRFPIVNMPNLKKLYLGNGGEWESICTALSTIRMSLDVSQEKAVTVFCGSPLDRDGDLGDAYLRTLVRFFGGNIAPVEIELHQEGEHGWEATKAWNTCRVKWLDYASTPREAEASIVFDDRPEWIQLGFGRTFSFDPALRYQSLWSLENLRAITLRTSYWASDVPVRFWSMLGSLARLEVVRTDAENALTEPFFKELGQSKDDVSLSSTLSFPSLKAIVLHLHWDDRPLNAASSSEADGPGQENAGHNETALDHLLEGILRAFKNRDNRRLDEFKLVFIDYLYTEDKDIARFCLMELEQGAVAKRVSVWDLSGDITWNSEVHDPIEYNE